MKYYFCIILILLISKYLSEEVDTQINLDKKKEQEKTAQEKITEYLKSLDLYNKKTLTKEELITIFRTVIEIGHNEIEDENRDNKKELENIENLAKQIYNILYTKEKDVIEIDKILDYFNFDKIKTYVVNFLKALGLDKFFETYGRPLLHLIEEIYNNYYKVTEL